MIRVAVADPRADGSNHRDDDDDDECYEHGILVLVNIMLTIHPILPITTQHSQRADATGDAPASCGGRGS